MGVIVLGDRDYKSITTDELKEFMLFEGLLATKHNIGGQLLEYWKVIDFIKGRWVDDTLWFYFSFKHLNRDTVVKMEAYIDFGSFTLFHESKGRCHVDHMNLSCINYLIKKGFNLPFENYKE